MNNYSKFNRQQVLRDLLRKTDIGSQDALMQELVKLGFRAAQATVSRDLREIGVVRVRTAGGGFRYEKLESHDPDAAFERLRTLARVSVTDIKGIGVLVLVKTLPGGAGRVSSLIDGLDRPDILGTIAGDDTILVVVNGEEKRAHVEKTFRDLL